MTTALTPAVLANSMPSQPMLVASPVMARTRAGVIRVEGRRRGVGLVVHGNFLEAQMGARCRAVDLKADGGVRATHVSPILDATSKNPTDLILRQVRHGTVRVQQHRDAVDAEDMVVQL